MRKGGFKPFGAAADGYDLVPLSTFHVRLGNAHQIGDFGAGVRRVSTIVDGDFFGILNGRILTGGFDWQTIRPDVVIVDARFVAQLSCGALLTICNQGYRHKSSNAPSISAESPNDVLPYFCSVLWFETAVESFAWLQRTIHIATAERNADQVTLEVASIQKCGQEVLHAP